MAKKTSKSASKQEDQDVIILDLKSLLTPLSILVSTLFLAIIIIVGFYSINETLKDLDGVSKEKNEEIAGEETGQEAEGQTALTNGDEVSTMVSEDTPMAGDDGAEVAIVEYADYGCGYCGRHASETLDQILNGYTENGDAAYYFKSFAIFTPLNSAGAYCANKLGGDDKFLEFHKELFAQEQVTGEESQVLEVAANVDLDENKFKECLNSDEAGEQTDADYQEAVDLGIGGTPGFVVGKLKDDGTVEGEFISGAQPYSYFEEVISKYL
ncbi:thioredoxin domain-containing protein [Candidatus Dojkabacteria bacterium]|nr:thioredoxin domain-containing protein [Candidatus Dojkabacteria bacterium]